jgi:hypothetical protein
MPGGGEAGVIIDSIRRIAVDVRQFATFRRWLGDVFRRYCGSLRVPEIHQ